MSRRSSCTVEERKEIGEMAKRLRWNQPKTPTMTDDESRRDFGKSVLEVDLLRGFGSTDNSRPERFMPPPSCHDESPVGMGSSSSVELLRGFGPSPSQDSGSDSGDDSFDDAFEEPREL